jgi:hypothetical protein
VLCVPREGRITYTLAPPGPTTSLNCMSPAFGKATITGRGEGTSIRQNGRDVPHSILCLLPMARFCQDTLNGLHHLRVDLLPRRDDVNIPAERAAEAKVKRTPKMIRDDSASPGGVIWCTTRRSKRIPSTIGLGGASALQLPCPKTARTRMY